MEDTRSGAHSLHVRGDQGTGINALRQRRRRASVLGTPGPGAPGDRKPAGGNSHLPCLIRSMAPESAVLYCRSMPLLRLAALVLALLGLPGGGYAGQWPQGQQGSVDKSGPYFSSGQENICAITSAGQLLCWGESRQERTAVPQLPAGQTWASVALGSGSTCGLTSAGAVFCFGSGYESGTDGAGRRERMLPAGQSWALLSSGFYGNCGISSLGELRCWNGFQDVLWDFSTLGGESVTALSGRSTSFIICAITSSGRLLCFGNFYDARQATVPGLPTSDSWTAVAIGYMHTCGITARGALLCWGGKDDGQTAVPSLPAGKIWTAVAAGWHHSCGLYNAAVGGILCWGQSSWGATVVPGLPFGQIWVAIAAELFGTCGLTSAGSLLCWGYNYPGATPILAAERHGPRPAVYAPRPADICSLRSTGRHR